MRIKIKDTTILRLPDKLPRLPSLRQNPVSPVDVDQVNNQAGIGADWTPAKYGEYYPQSVNASGQSLA